MARARAQQYLKLFFGGGCPFRFGKQFKMGSGQQLVHGIQKPLFNVVQLFVDAFACLL